ncbi:hypothetical protein OIV83_001849 [Microbotryomycetes sp. JL201]|nr:hypothetical protein OIV83_001849 [Microbotryomycetes sp. JL201]
MASSALPVVEFGDVEPCPASALPPFPCSFDPAPGPSQVSLQSVLTHVNKAKKVAVVCGAGISCASGIPDFRSSGGLFESLKRQYPEARLSSGKDLFDASLFQSEQNAAIFFSMIAELKRMADKASPTPFHRFLKTLDDQGKLFRVYTQNIDGLEKKAGLSYGLGDKSLPLPPRRAPRSPTKPKAAPPTTLGNVTKRVNDQAAKQEACGLPYPSPAPSPPQEPTSSQTTAAHAEIPKCIPLHGVLNTMSCAQCSTTQPVSPYLSELEAGQAISCPTCRAVDQTRASKGVRSRGVGKLKPDVVLYGEEHKDGERVGEITRRDLMGARPDLLLVVGTSLKVPGTKRLVRELAKVIRPPRQPVQGDDEGDDEDDDDDCRMPSASAQSSLSMASTSSKRSRMPKPPPVHVIYLNYEFPKPSTEWKDVFDVWLRGDVQEFVDLVERDKREAANKAEQRRIGKIERERRKMARNTARTGQDVKLPVDALPPLPVSAGIASKSDTLALGKTKSAGGADSLRSLNTKVDQVKINSRAASVKSDRSRASSVASSTRSTASADEVVVYGHQGERGIGYGNVGQASGMKH